MIRWSKNRKYIVVVGKKNLSWPWSCDRLQLHLSGISKIHHGVGQWSASRLIWTPLLLLSCLVCNVMLIHVGFLISKLSPATCSASAAGTRGMRQGLWCFTCTRVRRLHAIASRLCLWWSPHDRSQSADHDFCNDQCSPCSCLEARWLAGWLLLKAWHAEVTSHDCILQIPRKEAPWFVHEARTWRLRNLSKVDVRPTPDRIQDARCSMHLLKSITRWRSWIQLEFVAERPYVRYLQAIIKFVPGQHATERSRGGWYHEFRCVHLFNYSETIKQCAIITALSFQRTASLRFEYRFHVVFSKLNTHWFIPSLAQNRRIHYQQLLFTFMKAAPR